MNLLGEKRFKMKKNNIEVAIAKQEEYFDKQEPESVPSGEWTGYNINYLQAEAELAGMTCVSDIVGACSKCVYSLSTGKGDTHKDCKIGNGVHVNNWYCADFERSL